MVERTFVSSNHEKIEVVLSDVPADIYRTLLKVDSIAVGVRLNILHPAGWSELIHGVKYPVFVTCEGDGMGLSVPRWLTGSSLSIPG